LKRLALTFDDGPSQWTPMVRQLLRDHNARATFFLIGQRVREHPEEARAIVADGHEVGSHTLTHPRLTDLDEGEARREIEEGVAAVEEVLGTRPRLFRPPGFHADDRVLAIVGRFYNAGKEPSPVPGSTFVASGDGNCSGGGRWARPSLWTRLRLREPPRKPL